MDNEKIQTAPSFECFAEVAKGYGDLAVISNEVCEFIRKKGTLPIQALQWEDKWIMLQLGN